MKRKTVILTLIFTLLFITVSADVERYILARSNYPIIVNDIELKFDDGLPVMSYADGRCYIPLGKFLEITEADTKWQDGKLYIKTKPKYTTEEVADRNIKSTVRIICDNRQGTGIVIDGNMVVTNNHVVEKTKTIKVVLENKEYSGITTISQTPTGDSNMDIAFFECNTKYGTPAKMGDSDKIKVGERVVMIGNPKDDTGIVVEGIVSGFRYYKGYKYILTSCIANVGNSGSGVYNMDGELIGIHTYKSSDDFSMELTINTVKNFIRDKQ